MSAVSNVPAVVSPSADIKAMAANCILNYPVIFDYIHLGERQRLQRERRCIYNQPHVSIPHSLFHSK